MHAYQRSIVIFAVLHAQQKILAMHSKKSLQCTAKNPCNAQAGLSAVFSMHTVELILNMSIDPGIQDGLSGHSHAGV